MNEKRVRRLLTGLAVIVTVAGVALPLTGRASAHSDTPTETLDRVLEPVVVAGRDVSAMIGFPLDQLSVYVYVNGSWAQIPTQIDEVTAAGVYAATEDGLLDANDEIVFMAKDLGEKVPGSEPLARLPASSPGLYAIEVIDPTSPQRRAWAYLVHSGELAPVPSRDYVSFNAGFHRIVSASYALGLAVTHPGADYLTLGGKELEILDRTKLRVYCGIPIACPLTEDSLAPLPDHLVKDGPVRVILRDGNLLAYESMIWWTAAYSIPEFLRGSVRISTDFSRAATGARYFNEAIPDGVTVDGLADFVPVEPVSHWWQLSTLNGTLFQAADTTAIGGKQVNYYLDDSKWDGTDTGDRRHYGDTGIGIEDPNPVFTYTFAFYVGSGMQPNRGARYAGYFDHPLTVKTLFLEVSRRVYFPRIGR